MAENTDVTKNIELKANLTLTKDEIIERIVDAELEPLQAAADKLRLAIDITHAKVCKAEHIFCENHDKMVR